MALFETAYDRVITQLNLGVFVVSLDGTVLDANAQFLRLCGLSSADTLIAKPITQFFASPAQWADSLRELVQSRTLSPREVALVRADGSRFWAKLNAFVKSTDSENPPLIFGVLEDVTEQNDSPHSLPRNAHLFYEAVASAPEALAITALSGEFLAVNHRLAELFGYASVRELLDSKMNSSDLIAQSDRSKLQASAEPMFDEGRSVRGVELSAVRKDRTTFDADFSVVILRNKKNEPYAFLALVRDVSEMVKTRRALIESLEALREAQSVAHMGHYVFDIRANQWTCSEEIFRLYGVDKSYDVTWENWLALLHPDDVEQLRSQVREQVYARKQALDVECRIIRPRDKELRWLHVLGKLSLDANGEPTRIFGTVADITDAKRAEEARRHLEEQLRQSQKMEAIGLLAGGVAHDLNNMLTPVLGNADLLLLDGNLTLSQQSSIHNIVKAAQRAQQLVRQLMAFGRKQMLTMQRFELNDLASNFGTRLLESIRPSVHLSLRLNAASSHVRAEIRRQLEQVLRDLTENALDAMPNGGQLVIETHEEKLSEPHAELPAGRYVVLSVHDNGMGMPPALRQRIFEPFFTTKDTVKTKGLGLAAVYGIVRQHGGHIDAESVLGQGSVFRVYLPASMQQHGSQSNYPSVRLELARGHETILVAEDEEEVRKTTCSLLTHLGYRVLDASGPTEAFHLAQKHASAVKLLLTDVVMPEMNGVDLYRKLKEDVPTLRALFMSGYAKDIVAKDPVVDKAISFIQKPFTVQQLSQKVRSVLDGDENVV